MWPLSSGGVGGFFINFSRNPLQLGNTVYCKCFHSFDPNGLYCRFYGATDWSSRVVTVTSLTDDPVNLNPDPVNLSPDPVNLSPDPVNLRLLARIRSILGS